MVDAPESKSIPFSNTDDSLLKLSSLIEIEEISDLIITGIDSSQSISFQSVIETELRVILTD